MKDYYSILGLNSSCTQDDIRQAYKKLATKLHPDKNNGEKLFDDLFKNINEAYAILSNDEKRKQYDYKLKYSSSSTVKQENRNAQNRAYNQQSSKTDNKKDNEINDIIESLKEVAEVIKNSGSTIDIDKSKIGDLLINLLNDKLINDLIRIGDLYQNRVVINNVLDILNVLDIEQKKKILPKLLIIAGADNEIIEKIYCFDQKKEYKKRKKYTFANVKYILIVMVCLYIVFMNKHKIYENNDTNYTTSNIVTPNNNESTENPLESQLSEVIESRYKGNQLKTGDSPYDHFFGKGIYSKKFQNRLEIKNGQLHDVIVCLAEYNYPFKVIRNEYIRSGENFTMSNVPNGKYFIKSFYGKDWNPEKVLADGKIKGAFDTDFYFDKSANADDLIEMVQDNRAYTIMTVTLYAVNNGNMQTQAIKADEFFK